MTYLDFKRPFESASEESAEWSDERGEGGHKEDMKHDWVDVDTGSRASALQARNKNHSYYNLTPLGSLLQNECCLVCNTQTLFNLTFFAMF